MGIDGASWASNLQPSGSSEPSSQPPSTSSVSGRSCTLLAVKNAKGNYDIQVSSSDGTSHTKLHTNAIATHSVWGKVKAFFKGLCGAGRSSVTISAQNDGANIPLSISKMVLENLGIGEPDSVSEKDFKTIGQQQLQEEAAAKQVENEDAALGSIHEFTRELALNNVVRDTGCDLKSAQYALRQVAIYIKKNNLNGNMHEIQNAVTQQLLHNAVQKCDSKEYVTAISSLLTEITLTETHRESLNLAQDADSDSFPEALQKLKDSFPSPNSPTQ